MNNSILVSLDAFADRYKRLRIVRIVLSKKVGDTYEPTASYILNPETRIPHYLSRKTGLTDSELLDAPTFETVAESLFHLFEDRVLVGHDASFIHFALQSEFRNYGYSFKIPQVCTKRLSKVLLPNFLQYELRYLSNILGIHVYEEGNIDSEHAALVELVERLEALDEDGKALSSIEKKPLKKEPSFPNGITYAHLKRLPRQSGIYFFKDEAGHIIYVGKAKDIQKRVISHFYHESEKERRLCQDTFSVDFGLAGSELLALLMESDYIQQYDPVHNYIQKKKYVTYHIVPQKNRMGFTQLKIERRPFAHVPTEIFLKRGEAIKRLEELTAQFQLCPKYTQLAPKSSKCNTLDSNPKCPLCSGVDSQDTYNERVNSAMNYLNSETRNYVIFEKGRSKGEKGFVLVRHGVYQGFGFIDETQTILGISDIENYLNPKAHTYHTAKILHAYRTKYSYKLRHFDSPS